MGVGVPLPTDPGLQHGGQADSEGEGDLKQKQKQKQKID